MEGALELGLELDHRHLVTGPTGSTGMMGPPVYQVHRVHWVWGLHWTGWEAFGWSGGRVADKGSLGGKELSQGGGGSGGTWN